MSFTVVKRTPKPHYCDYPGWWKRRKLKLNRGSIVLCDCGKQWQWAGFDGGWRLLGTPLR